MEGRRFPKPAHGAVAVSLLLCGTSVALGKSREAPRGVLLCQDRQSVWARARAPGVSSYCQLLAFAQASVWSSPARATRMAERAQRLSPGGLDAQFVLALAELSASDVSAASDHFEAAIGSAPGASIEPSFRLGAARAALLSGRYPEALVHYRNLALSIRQLPGGRLRAQALLEAALAVHYASPAGGEEARAFLRQARSHFAPLLWPLGVAIEVLTHSSDASSTEAPALGREDYYALAWALSRAVPGRGAPFDLLPVLPPGGREMILGAVAGAVAPEEAPLQFAAALQAAPGAPSHLLSLARRWAPAAPVSAEESDEEED